MEQFSRTELILGASALSYLKNCHVAVFGIGGVGGSLALSLVRSGVGEITVIDHDVVSLSNINRQAVAFHSTLGKKKVDVFEKIAKDINPSVKVNTYDLFFEKATENEIVFEAFDYVADAIDSVSSKIRLTEICAEKNIPIISSMGTGNKLHPEMFEISDINRTSVCPLARVMRRELKNRGIKKLKVLYSKEEPRQTDKKTVGSISFCPPTAGLIISGEIIRDLIANTDGFSQKDNEEFV